MKKFSPFLVSLLLTVVGLAACVTPARAATAPVAISYTPATTYTDGTPLGADLARYDINCTLAVNGGGTAPCVFTPTSFGAGSVGGTISVTYPVQGGHACVTLVTVTTVNARSVPSNQACADIPPLTPSPPTNVSISITLAVVIKLNGETVAANELKVEK